MADIRHLENR